MNLKYFTTALLMLLMACPLSVPQVEGCCPAPRIGHLVANADQTVIILWDAANKMQHFIRQANFKSDNQEFGFVVPSPSQPELAESGNDVFSLLSNLTKPKVIYHSRPSTSPAPRSGFGCFLSSPPPKSAAVKSASPPVRVLEEKQVAGFDAVVFEADSATALVEWMKEHDFNYSPAVEAWAKPYVEQKWKFTALKIAKKDASDETNPATAATQTVAASALRISFKTERPLFPYREPDYGADLEKLQAKSRLLRFFFLADARYQGTLTEEKPWTGNAVWSNKLPESERTKLLETLRLPKETGPQEFWLTEFEDPWPYELAPADLYFAADQDQSTLERPPVHVYVQSNSSGDITLFAVFGFVALPWLYRRKRKTLTQS